jgi:hypothetical protein
MKMTQQTTKTSKGDPRPSRQPRLTGPAYKMPKRVKTLLSRITDPLMRSHYKRMMIDAHVTALCHAAEAAKKKDKKSAE